MCRYARKTYKSHYVCFKCRKSFKQPDAYDIIQRIEKEKIYHNPNGKSIRKVGHVFTKAETKELEKMVSDIENRTVKCPECSNVMADLGKDFKAPKKTAVKEWRIVESLFKTGKCFHSCGCDGIGYIPKNPKDYETYLNTILKTYQEYLTACQKIHLEECPKKIEEIKYWSENIQKIKTEIIDNRFEIT
ncbi:hypothetical protein KYG33_09985 [Chryseobacterium sp. D764]|jgi:DNA-directed RNA polymerase subunit RPC12/RpoP|uniref:hypothetical protein n=1 Tax=unclassified Chryseobacterium TaxID=2593645 RepID=UPI00098443C9|nr:MULTISPECIES: hypothetical protein [unclassified Chryseobacterium]QXU51346.1 hypothetical protein KYG33_09985 [Chryseobacterium sp. D764]CAD0220909.1 conserved protein of unknown function [Chryseobacterium sp. JV274]